MPSPDTRLLCGVVVAADGRMMSYFGLVPHGSPFDQPNAAYGVLFYLAALLHEPLTVIPGRRYLMLAASVLSLGLSAWLGYILRYVLHDLCVVCVTTYVLNLLIFYFSCRNVCCRSGKSKHE